jgi:CheY-like chemotaxis protein
MNFLSATTSQQFPPPFPHTTTLRSKPVHHQQLPVSTDGKRLVLVVDDVPDIAWMLAAYLERAGYRVVSVFSAGEALDAVKAEHFDVIISDVGLPQMDGYELAKELRALPEYVTTPLIAVTGFAEYADQQNAFTAGFDAHLRKPIDPTRLIELIAHLGY